jgi:hypothetical protein
MPALSHGTYAVDVSGPGKDPFVQGESASFNYFPYNLAAFPFFGVLVAVVVAMWNRMDRAYSGAKNLVLLPSAAAIVWGLLSEPTWGIIVGAPLHAVTATFLVWRMAKVRSWGAGIALVVVGAMLGAVFSLVPAFPNLGPLLAVALAIPMVLLGIMIGVPLVVARATIRETVQTARLFMGAAAGLPFAVITFAFVTFVLESPIRGLLASIALFIVPVVVFSILICGNRWARDVATGAMFAVDPSPSAPSPAKPPEEFSPDHSA